jgi:hypothetical protein
MNFQKIIESNDESSEDDNESLLFNDFCNI